MAVMITDAISAIGNDHQIILTSPESESRYAAGKRTTNCLIILTNILNIPLPNAWKVEERTIQAQANTKLMLIILKAIIPISIICSDASNKRSIASGNSCITINPQSIIETA